MAKVLVVDDHEMIRGMLKTLLESSDLVVETAANGKEGVDHVREYGAPDLVVMDIEMPVMTGPEAIRVLRRDHPGINILVHTGKDPHSLTIPKDLPILKKPSSLAQVMQAVRAVIPP